MPGTTSVQIKSHLIDNVDALFKGQDGEETTTTRRRLKDQRKQEVRRLYEATIDQRVKSDPARIVMTNDYRQQYDEGTTKPLMSSLLGGKYYGAKGRILDLGRPHGMSARMAGIGATSPGRPQTAGAGTSTQGDDLIGMDGKPVRPDISQTVVSPTGKTRDVASNSLRRETHDDGIQVDPLTISDPVVSHYPPRPTEKKPEKKAEVHQLLPFPQDDAHDYFGKKLKPKPQETVENRARLACRSIGTEPARGPVPYVPEEKPKQKRIYNYEHPKPRVAPIRSVQTNTDVQGQYQWDLAAKRLPKMGVVGEVLPIHSYKAPAPRPQSADVRGGRFSNRPTDTAKFLF